MKDRKLATSFLIAALGCLFVVPANAVTRASANYSITAETLDGGGRAAGSADYSSVASVEPGAIGASAGSSYSAQHGFITAQIVAVAALIEGRWVFYNRSAWDGNDPAANANDDNAIATDKSALLPGGVATFANYTSYSRGLNGLVVDISNLSGTPTIADFALKTGNDNTPASWATAPDPVSVTARNLGGGVTRLTLIWNDNNLDATADANEAVAKRWLQVTVKATANTGLPADDVFYFGNAVGESGNSAANAQVNSTDVNGTRANPHFSINPAGIEDAYDFNRDRLVNSTDVNLARIHTTFSINALQLITPAGGGGSVQGLAPGEAAFTATKPVRIEVVENAEGTAFLNLRAPVSGEYALESTSDLRAGMWQTVEAAVRSESETASWQVPLHPRQARRFFRFVPIDPSSVQSR